MHVQPEDFGLHQPVRDTVLHLNSYHSDYVFEIGALKNSRKYITTVFQCSPIACILTDLKNCNSSALSMPCLCPSCDL